MANEKSTRVPPQADETDKVDHLVEELVGPAAAQRLKVVMPATATARAVLGTPGVKNQIVLDLRRSR